MSNPKTLNTPLNSMDALFDLIKELGIQGLCLDSRRVAPGDLFIALSGHDEDGKRYIPDAINKGASAVLIEKQNSSTASTSNIPLTHLPIPMIEFEHLRENVSAIAGRFYSDPSLDLSVIGITGTNGKTSISHFIAQILETLGYSSTVMGTLGHGFLKKLQWVHQSTNTTLDPITTQQEMASYKKQGAKMVAMEVTSHALTQGRVEGLHFKTAIFTNLTRDHLDYHQNMSNYFAAKKRLFTELNPKNAVINLDDEYGQQLMKILEDQGISNQPDSNDKNKDLKELKERKATRLIGFTCKLDDEPSDPRTGIKWADKEGKDLAKKYEMVLAKDMFFTETGIQAYIETPWGKGQLICPLLGRFNLSNVLAAVTALCLENIPLAEVLKAVQELKPVAGRMTTIQETPGSPRVIIDYAHTPDALSEALQAMRLHLAETGTLHCVFGCGGDRDKGKRREMAAITETYADKIVVTQDNPRTENPDTIIQDILKGFKDPQKITIEQDRKKAIRLAIQEAEADDMILIAGKGHEHYQILGKEKIHFSDQEEAEQALKVWARGLHE